MSRIWRRPARLAWFAGLACMLAAVATPVAAEDKPGDTKGSILEPSPDNLAATWSKANLVLPASLTGRERWQGVPSAAPEVTGRAPLVVLLHGSSGIAPAIREYQVWLADTLGLASVAPDSLAIPDRLTYVSPVPVELYERIHTLRLAELTHALASSKAWAWVDRNRIVLAGTSEGAVAVGRYAGADSLARLIYSWSCETNYFVDRPRLGFGPEDPVFNAISARDPYFSPNNPWNKDYPVTGNCGGVLKVNPHAVVYVVDADVHTILNRPDVHEAASRFLANVLKP